MAAPNVYSSERGKSRKTAVRLSAGFMMDWKAGWPDGSNLGVPFFFFLYPGQMKTSRDKFQKSWRAQFFPACLSSARSLSLAAIQQHEAIYSVYDSPAGLAKHQHVTKPINHLPFDPSLLRTDAILKVRSIRALIESWITDASSFKIIPVITPYPARVTLFARCSAQPRH